VRVALFDYGAGNLHSLGKALEGAGARVEVTDRWERALACDALVLPGVGAFSAAVEALPDDPRVIRRALEDGLPCLGICLGMQLLFETSEEGAGRGIGLLPGRVRRLEASVVPQMGWNDVETGPDPLFRGTEGLVAYYANSYVCEPSDGGERADPVDHPAIAWSEIDGLRFVAAVRRGRTWGVQFHPEKSSVRGRRIIANFLGEAAR
jgi:glutamine amidotransferase